MHAVSFNINDKIQRKSLGWERENTSVFDMTLMLCLNLILVDGLKA